MQTGKKLIDRILSDSRLIIVGGVGGVGKTTTSAALALQAALNGKSVAVLTIDPARRLGEALGFKTLGNELRYSPAKKLDPYRKKKGGKIAAAMLDVKSTFDGIVKRYSPSPDVADRILRNRYYGELSEALSGTHEYMALEKIYEIHSTMQFDLLILDTPPDSAMVDFLQAPMRLRSFLDRDIVRWFFPEKRSGLRGLATAAIGKGMSWALGILDKLAGGQVLEDVAHFLSDFQSLFEGFKERISTVEDILSDDKTRYLLVSTSDRVPMLSTIRMIHTLDDNRLHLAGILLNRSVRKLSAPPAVGRKTESPFSVLAKSLVEQEKNFRKEIRKEAPDLPVIDVVLQADDPTTIAALAKMIG